MDYFFPFFGKLLTLLSLILDLDLDDKDLTNLKFLVLVAIRNATYLAYICEKNFLSRLFKGLQEAIK